MAGKLDAIFTTDVIEALENFMARKRPAEEIRDQLDLDYRIEGQNVYIFEVRPQWDDKSKIMHMDVAKTTYVKSKDNWKVYWMRGNLKWYPYDPATADTLEQFIDMVDKDRHGCFFG
ncbi:DUF3024 domain-containing protein [Roseivirga sp. BDSF3-8]|uniref:DUF3024 domain-containing protein n=1 Tax=Roseivirga sp. BDSF3-8 TaxID=3241598 RepID=UPI0035326FC5